MPEASAPGVWEPGQGSLIHSTPTALLSDSWTIWASNRPEWSLDHLTLYLMDSLVYSVRAYGYNVQTGGLVGGFLASPLHAPQSKASVASPTHPPSANPWLMCQLEPEQGIPDGLCMDTTGTLWVACIDVGRVIRMDPETATGRPVQMAEVLGWHLSTWPVQGTLELM
ncbi:regucalcin-like isoform X2 [Ictidomys tridecemlineatus]